VASAYENNGNHGGILAVEAMAASMKIIMKAK
jgi:hypothetical protein